jgi:hypothetical protein
MMLRHDDGVCCAELRDDGDCVSSGIINATSTAGQIDMVSSTSRSLMVAFASDPLTCPLDELKVEPTRVFTLVGGRGIAASFRRVDRPSAPGQARPLLPSVSPPVRRPCPTVFPAAPAETD